MMWKREERSVRKTLEKPAAEGKRLMFFGNCGWQWKELGNPG